MKKYIFLFVFSAMHLLAFCQWNTDRILTIGRNALYFEDYVLSIQYFNQVIKIKPYMAEPYMYRAMAKIQLGDDKGAELDATEALERNPFLPEAYYIRGFARRKAGDYKEAVKDFSTAYDFSPNSLNLLLNRMDTYVRLEKYEEAMNDLNVYAKQSPKNKQLLYEKGVIQMLMKDTVAAQKTFEEYARTDSTNSQAWSALALFKLQKDSIEGAYADYSKAIKLKSTNPGDYINRGIVNVRRKNFREALKDYDKAIALDKTNVLAYYNRGLLRANLGDNNNALADLEKVVASDTTQIEAYYRKAVIQNSLKMYKKSISDFTKIIQNHPTFLPAYWGLAEAYDGLKNKTEAFRYRQMAYNIEKNKDQIQKKKKDDLVADNKIDKGKAKTGTSKKTEVFNRFVTKNIDDSQSDTKYGETQRGNIQNKFADLINERNFVLTYYAKPDELRRTNLYHAVVEDYNKLKKLSSPLKITNIEIPLTSDLVNMHFEAINTMSNRLQGSQSDADLLYNRSMEFAMVQDFNSSVDDLNAVLSLNPNFTLAYFSRANVRYKLVEYNKSIKVEDAGFTINNELEQSKKNALDNKYKYEVEMIMRDLDKVIEQQPSFAFAYFNKANIVCTQKDFSAGISYYSIAIQKDPDFAEAYFNRGLTYLFIGEDTKGISDLSKAGELGIYQAYNLIQRFSK
ncbi:MAG: tetratricopeptide repeat protein [Paludibacter sp.]|nr:tetratricopeptide repeat protein [Paludibacter sp.]